MSTNQAQIILEAIGAIPHTDFTVLFSALCGRMKSFLEIGTPEEKELAQAFFKNLHDLGKRCSPDFFERIGYRNGAYFKYSDPKNAGTWKVEAKSNYTNETQP